MLVMMFTPRLVRVLDGDQHLDDRVCQLVRLRDGGLAALWRGLAYPIGPGDVIDVSRDGVSRTECLPEARSSVATPAGTQRWTVVEGADEAWLLISGDVVQRDAAAARLRDAKLTVLRVGAWLGDPVDGIGADWFIRFVRPDASSLPGLLEPILGCAPLRSSSGTETEPPAHLRLRLIETELIKARGQIAALAAELARLRSKEAETAVQLASRLATLEADLAMAHEQLADASAPPPPATPPPAVAAPPPPALPHARSPRRMQAEVETVLKCLLPHIRLLRDGPAVVAGEYRDRTSFYRAMGELQTAHPRLPPAWFRVRGVEDWWERHVSNGDDDSGRTYARFSPAEKIWSVVVSFKEQQTRDLAWIRGQKDAKK